MARGKRLVAAVLLAFVVWQLGGALLPAPAAAGAAVALGVAVWMLTAPREP